MAVFLSRFVLRNYIAERAIQAAENGDFCVVRCSLTKVKSGDTGWGNLGKKIQCALETRLQRVVKLEGGGGRGWRAKEGEGDDLPLLTAYFSLPYHRLKSIVLMKQQILRTNIQRNLWR